jgi:hypothetical protein
MTPNSPHLGEQLASRAIPSHPCNLGDGTICFSEISPLCVEAGMCAHHCRCGDRLQKIYNKGFTVHHKPHWFNNPAVSELILAHQEERRELRNEILSMRPKKTYKQIGAILEISQNRIQRLMRGIHS